MSAFNPDDFQLSREHSQRLDHLHDAFISGVERHLGFPANILYDYTDLHRFFNFTINNVGDPFADEGIYEINTHAFEREVLAFFADLYHASEGAYGGHITNGGTEGNMYALYLAREALPDGIMYFSHDAHYSMPKIAKVLGVPYRLIRSQANGEMDYTDLEKQLGEHPDRPPIIVATIGTTMKGAVDRIEEIVEVLKCNAIENFYIHCDGALGGMVLPFVEHAPLFDFQLPISSISVSGHKMIGSPIPCGVVIVRKEHVARVQREIELIGSHDTTLSGSRNGHSVLFLWCAVQRFGIDGFKQMIARCFDLKKYTLKKLKETSWDAYSGDYSVIIMIKRPSDRLVRKWQLAIEKDSAHLVIMPNITKEHIDAFIEDLRQEKTRLIKKKK
ncbi:histidine decarboxylase [Candidatus Kaiserbacteria bacterium]|nr:histidine decarboxylase [Candidatus Kaiserbacteria bacterium]